jgi:hypothetical protein
MEQDQANDSTPIKSQVDNKSNHNDNKVDSKAHDKRLSDKELKPENARKSSSSNKRFEEGNKSSKKDLNAIEDDALSKSSEKK